MNDIVRAFLQHTLRPTSRPDGTVAIGDHTVMEADALGPEDVALESVNDPTHVLAAAAALAHYATEHPRDSIAIMRNLNRILGRFANKHDEYYGFRQLMDELVKINLKHSQARLEDVGPLESILLAARVYNAKSVSTLQEDVDALSRVFDACAITSANNRPRALQKAAAKVAIGIGATTGKMKQLVTDPDVLSFIGNPKTYPRGGFRVSLSSRITGALGGQLDMGAVASVQNPSCTQVNAGAVEEVKSLADLSSSAMFFPVYNNPKVSAYLLAILSWVLMKNSIFTAQQPLAFASVVYSVLAEFGTDKDAFYKATSVLDTLCNYVREFYCKEGKPNPWCLSGHAFVYGASMAMGKLQIPSIPLVLLSPALGNAASYPQLVQMFMAVFYDAMRKSKQPPVSPGTMKWLTENLVMDWQGRTPVDVVDAVLNGASILDASKAVKAIVPLKDAAANAVIMKEFKEKLTEVATGQPVIEGLSPPTVSPGDIAKVLELQRCFAGNLGQDVTVKAVCSATWETMPAPTQDAAATAAWTLLTLQYLHKFLPGAETLAKTMDDIGVNFDDDELSMTVVDDAMRRRAFNEHIRDADLPRDVVELAKLASKGINVSKTVAAVLDAPSAAPSAAPSTLYAFAKAAGPLMPHASTHARRVNLFACTDPASLLYDSSTGWSFPVVSAFLSWVSGLGSGVLMSNPELRRIFCHACSVHVTTDDTETQAIVQEVLAGLSDEQLATVLSELSNANPAILDQALLERLTSMDLTTEHGMSVLLILFKCNARHKDMTKSLLKYLAYYSYLPTPAQYGLYVAAMNASGLYTMTTGLLTVMHSYANIVNPSNRAINMANDWSRNIGATGNRLTDKNILKYAKASAKASGGMSERAYLENATTLWELVNERSKMNIQDKVAAEKAETEEEKKKKYEPLGPRFLARTQSLQLLAHLALCGKSESTGELFRDLLCPTVL